MNTARRANLVLSIALLTAALLIPASAQAQEAAPLAGLTAAATDAAIVLSKAASNLEWIDARLAVTRDRLAATESRLPDGLPGETRAFAMAIGANFSPALADMTDALAADRRLHMEIATEVSSLEAERVSASLEVERARRSASIAKGALDEALQLEAERIEAERIEAERVAAEQAARDRAERAAAFGHFPVAGPVEYIDSWGFARSGGRRHKGTDIMAATGTPVVAVRDGAVTSKSGGIGGRTVWLTADDGTRYYYAHLDTITVHSGRVTAGQVLGTVGSTGNATASAPHLHFEIHMPQAVNPFPLLKQMVV